MAKKGGFEDFDIDDLENLIEDVDTSLKQAMSYAAKATINEARAIGSYTDQTGSLRASLGYGILDDGAVVEQNIPNISRQLPGQPAVTSRGPQALQEAAAASQGGLEVVLIAGMPYASYVEARGYDVITGARQKFDDFFKEATE